MTLTINYLLIVFIIFESAGICWASELTFLLQPSDVIAVRDRPLMLDCAVQGEEPVLIAWHKNGVPIPNSQRTQILENGTLLIQRFQKRRDGGYTDAGDYDCAVQSRYGLLVSRKAKVRLACESLIVPELQVGQNVFSNILYSRFMSIWDIGFFSNFTQIFCFLTPTLYFRG